MKTFASLVEEVQKPGLCHLCGGCLTFCTAINYGALEMDEDGMPYLSDMEKCTECGLCYSICPEINELDDDIRKNAGWSEPMGRIMETHVAHAIEPEIRQNATDGGVVTGLLLHLFEEGRIDGAIVTKPSGRLQREPWLAITREEIAASAGFYFDTSHGMKRFLDGYSIYTPSTRKLKSMLQQGLRKVALVGMPCQITAIRKTEALGVLPSDSIHYCLGLFCSGNFFCGSEQQEKLAEIGGFEWENVQKYNIKETFLIHLKDGETKSIPLEHLDFMKRPACRFCADYAAEFADISCGGIGAPEGQTTVIIRTQTGRRLFNDACGQTIELFDAKDKVNLIAKALKQIEAASAAKKRLSAKHRQAL
ncbi:Coenzyme F420 hydrogenase/dehydrogenase, beta subunit C-terminal domain [Desulfococcaceae bacterium HSG9]|nr:Coenzyme F420 hydrogenase/dehydrogenase, beta subunit C-terminal domain [Desulfococcaceae bacterium HSG9]